ncbi:uncharacterized protein LOC118227802 [Anguilla anguilla]|uniref:uncharacterized protein LOC118227802 n=1 Tax=Anguilla anguilla TaxID=7936 RepID=UPI0015AC1877|nr:uncharacterized protein LOC118227802 [Anguilla anguilla]XP_035274612.1 uncharacterized protein LOC118227802 [Anguilla anguilla]XP_035274613.1 uncharacterized protein LOC118227802 [Anguilla anguilla]
MAGIPAVHLSTLCLALFCSSVLGHAMDNSTWTPPSTSTPEAHQSERPATELYTTVSAATETSAGPDANITKPTTPPGPTTLITRGRTDGQPREMTSVKGTPTTSSQTPQSPTVPSSSSSVPIVVSLVVLIVVLILLLYVLSLFRNRRWARGAWGCLGRAVARARAALSWLGIRLWPGKSGGREDEEEDEEDEGNSEREGDVELGNGMAAEVEKEKREEEEEEDSSDDYSSMEGFDPRERARQGKEEDEERGKGPSQCEDREEEGKSGEAVLLERSKEGGMEECDLTAL